jgi:transitional endoplasmic reticulum ATPase
MLNDSDRNIAALLEALQATPENIQLRKYVADMLVQIGRAEEAIEHLKIVIEQGGGGSALISMAGACYNLGKFAGARRALLDVPEGEMTAQAFMLLSKVQFALGEYESAGESYGEAVDRDPSLADEEYLDELGSKAVKVRAKLRVVDFPGPSTQDDIFERPGTDFSDVGGLDDLKESIRMNIIYPFQNPDLFRSYGRKVGGGILLYGPPGCGKTFIARATAGECNASFVNISITDILDLYIGESEKNLNRVFDAARSKAPAIIFIDELDAIGGSRQQMQSHHGRTLTNQLLTELDGIHVRNEGVLVLGATNSPWFVDSALRRPGRFDRVLFVPPPDLKARIEILNIYLRERPTENIDFAEVARKMERYSGADIKAVCDAAADYAIMEAIRGGKPRPIRTSDLLNAVKKVKPSTLEWLSTAKNYATYSNESGIYNDILEYLK